MLLVRLSILVPVQRMLPSPALRPLGRLGHCATRVVIKEARTIGFDNPEARGFKSFGLHVALSRSQHNQRIAVRVRRGSR